MGNLVIKKNLFNKIIFKSFESKTIRFKGPVGTTLYNFIDPWIYFNNINNNFVMNIYVNGLNNSSTTFTSDGIDWYDNNGINLMNDYVIPLDTIFQLESTSNIYALLDLGGNAENYYQGKTNIKKQDLTKLKSGSFYNEQESTYVFRSATNNTLAQIFNPTQFEAYTDGISLYDSNLNFISTFFTDGTSWLYDDFTTIADNYILPINSIFAFNTTTNFNILVNGGTVIQKLYNGKMLIGKQNIKFLTPYKINNVIYNSNAIFIYKGGNINTLDTVFNKNQFTGGNSYGVTADGIVIQEPNGTFKLFYYYDDGFGGSIDPIQWQEIGSGGADQANYIIQPNSRLFAEPLTNKNYSIGNGAIVNKYY